MDEYLIYLVNKPEPILVKCDKIDNVWPKEGRTVFSLHRNIPPDEVVAIAPSTATIIKLSEDMKTTKRPAGTIEEDSIALSKITASIVVGCMVLLAIGAAIWFMWC